MSAATTLDDRTAQRRFRWAALACGLLCGLGYALATWGYDAWVLAHTHADLPWARLEIGLPLLLLLGALGGVLAARSARAGAWVGVGMAGGALAGFVTGQIPFTGSNLATWIAEPRLRGVNVYPPDPTGVQRTLFVVIATACMGAAIGLLSHVVVERVLHLASQPDHRSRWAWAVVLLCLPLGLLPGLIGDEIINRPLRLGPQAVAVALSAVPRGDSGLGDAGSLQGLFPGSAGYALHLVDYDREPPAQATIDVAFDQAGVLATGVPTELVARCQTSGSELVGCSSISPQFEAWMGALVQRARHGEPGTELDPQAGQVSVGDEVLGWLALQRESLGDTYTISRDAQRGGWVLMSARFDTGYVLTCYFHGSAPVAVEHCTEGR